MDFDRLDALLKERHISRRKLALACGIAESTMSTAFMRRSGLSVDQVIAIAKYLNVDYYYLEGLNKDVDENNIAYYDIPGKGITISVPSALLDDPYDSEAIKAFNQRIELYIERLKKARKERESEDIAAVENYMRKLNIMGRFQVLTYAEDMTLIPKYQKTKDEKQGE